MSSNGIFRNAVNTFGRSNQADINAGHGDYLHVKCWKWAVPQESFPCCIIEMQKPKYGNVEHYRIWWEPEYTFLLQSYRGKMFWQSVENLAAERFMLTSVKTLLVKQYSFQTQMCLIYFYLTYI